MPTLTEWKCSSSVISRISSDGIPWKSSYTFIAWSMGFFRPDTRLSNRDVDFLTPLTTRAPARTIVSAYADPGTRSVPLIEASGFDASS